MTHALSHPTTPLLRHVVTHLVCIQYDHGPVGEEQVRRETVRSWNGGAVVAALCLHPLAVTAKDACGGVLRVENFQRRFHQPTIFTKGPVR